jgi:hypothetical protein
MTDSIEGGIEYKRIEGLGASLHCKLIPVCPFFNIVVQVPYPGAIIPAILHIVNHDANNACWLLLYNLIIVITNLVRIIKH